MKKQRDKNQFKKQVTAFSVGDQKEEEGKKAGRDERKTGTKGNGQTKADSNKFNSQRSDVDRASMNKLGKLARQSTGRNESLTSVNYEKRRHSSALDSNLPRKSSITSKQNGGTPKNSYKDVQRRNSGKFVGSDKIKKYHTSKERKKTGFGSPTRLQGPTEKNRTPSNTKSNNNGGVQASIIMNQGPASIATRKGTKDDPLTSKDRAQFNRKAQKVQNLKPIGTASRQRGSRHSERADGQSTMTEKDQQIS